MRTLIKECTINRPIDEVFDFFSRAENLNLLTPPELHFEILSDLPIIIQKGTLIDYRIKLNGIRFKWRTEITEWEPPYRFADRQVFGPYKIWIHEHVFAANGSKTIMTDKLYFRAPGRFLEPLVYKFFVKKNLKKILDYRESKLQSIFNEIEDNNSW